MGLSYSEDTKYQIPINCFVEEPLQGTAETETSVAGEYLYTTWIVNLSVLS